MMNDGRFLISYWFGVPERYMFDTDGRVQTDRLLQIKAAGFNHIDAAYDTEKNKKILISAQELGLYVTVNDTRMREAISDPEKRESLLSDIVSDYSGYGSLLGYHVYDEPSPAMMETLGKVTEILSRMDSEHEAYINLFPNYAFPGPMGDMSYDEYVAEFVRKVKPSILSFDNYHYMDTKKLESMTIDSELRTNAAVAAAYNKTDRLGFLDNLEVIRNQGLLHDIPYMSIILVVEHGPYRYVTEEEMRWDVMHSLAYGCSRQCYFTYWTPGENGTDSDEIWHWTEGMISQAGEPNRHYYDVGSINEELAEMGAHIMGRKSLGVFYTSEAPETLTSVFEGFGCVESAEGDNAVIGFFEGNYAVIANESAYEECELTLKCDCSMDVFDAYSGEWISIESVDGAYTLSLGAGDGMLVRFINKIRR